MTLYQFIALNEEEKAQAAWEGEFLMFREHYEHTVLLYKISDFYVEVFYQRESNAIDKIRPFKTKKLLESYFHLCRN